MFKQYFGDPNFSQAVATLKRLYELYTSLANSEDEKERVQAHGIWRDMGEVYWDILFALIDIKAKEALDILQFDYDERLFIDLGYMPGIMKIHSEFNPGNFLTAKTHGGIFPVMSFSDYISYYWSLINGSETPRPNLGLGLAERTRELENDLKQAQTARDNFLLEIADSFNVQINARQAVQDLDNCLMPAMKYSLRVPEYREGNEDTRLNITRERKVYIDTENAIMLMLSTVQQAEENPLPVFEVDAFKEMHENTKILAKKLLYTQMDERKIARRSQKITADFKNTTDTMKRTALKDMLAKKKEYMAVPAKNARCDQSLLCQANELPSDYVQSAASLEKFSSMDMEMFNVPRVRMYGIPTVIFIPGQGLGTYDWLDHSLLIPAFPVGGVEKSLTYALGTFRWDSDEDQKLRTPYGQIKEHRKQSSIAMGSSFYKDYALYMTREKQGYRILPRETHKAFEQMFKVKADE